MNHSQTTSKEEITAYYSKIQVLLDLICCLTLYKQSRILKITKLKKIYFCRNIHTQSHKEFLYKGINYKGPKTGYLMKINIKQVCHYEYDVFGMVSMVLNCSPMQTFIKKKETLYRQRVEHCLTVSNIKVNDKERCHEYIIMEL